MASHHLDVGLDRAGGLDRLQDADQIAGADAEPVEAVDELLQRYAVFHQRELLAVFGHPDPRVRRHRGSSARQRIGLADLRALGNRDGEIALRDRHGGDADIAAHHDDAGALVDHDLGGEIGFDLQLLDLGQEGDDVAFELRRNRKLHGRGIDRFGGLDAEEIVDRGGDALGGGEIGIAQREPHIGQAVEREFDLAFDDGAIGDAADSRHAAGDLGGFAFGLEAADRDRALRHRIDVAVGAEQGGDEQGAALQILRIAERGDRDVHPGALGAERGQIAGHHHGGDVAGADGGAADIDAHALEHRLQRLFGEGNVVQGVAGAVEADYQAVADQLVLPHAFDV